MLKLESSNNTDITILNYSGELKAKIDTMEGQKKLVNEIGNILFDLCPFGYSVEDFSSDIFSKIKQSFREKKR